MSEYVDDDDDIWVELQRPLKYKPGDVMPLAQARTTLMNKGRKDSLRLPKSYLTLRREMLDWAVAQGKRFRIELGGGLFQKLRLIPDAANGRYVMSVIRGSGRIALGTVEEWPAEARELVACKVEFTVANELVLILPLDFVRKQKSAMVETLRVNPADAPAPSAAPRGVYNFGDPEPGRSALDQRHGK